MSYVTIDDPNDRSFLLNGQSQFLAWAYGPRAVEESLRNLAFFHIEYPRNGGDMNRPKGYDTSSRVVSLLFRSIYSNKTYI